MSNTYTKAPHPASVGWMGCLLFLFMLSQSTWTCSRVISLHQQFAAIGAIVMAVAQFQLLCAETFNAFGAHQYINLALPLRASRHLVQGVVRQLPICRRFQLIIKRLGLLRGYLLAILLGDSQDLFRGLTPLPAFSAFPHSLLFPLLKMYLKRASRCFRFVRSRRSQGGLTGARHTGLGGRVK